MAAHVGSAMRCDKCYWRSKCAEGHLTLPEGRERGREGEPRRHVGLLPAGRGRSRPTGWVYLNKGLLTMSRTALSSLRSRCQNDDWPLAWDAFFCFTSSYLITLSSSALAPRKPGRQ